MSFLCPAMMRDTVEAVIDNGSSTSDSSSLSSSSQAKRDPARDQLYDWEKANKGKKYVARDLDGLPVTSMTTVMTIGHDGPPVIMDTDFTRAIQSFNRSNIPLRLVHGKGIGAHGLFRVTHDITKYTKAKIFAPGTVTEMFGRFSSNDFPGQPDTSNNQAHTMCMKFYTEDGNLDFLTLNFPVFDVRDALNFLEIHGRALQQNPQTGRTVDGNSVWNITALKNERLQMVVRAHSDQGFPKTFRHMDTFAVSIFHFENESGNLVYGRFHFKTNQGVQNYTKKQSDKLAGTNPDVQMKDFYNSIVKGNFPSFTVCCQIMTEEERIAYEAKTGLDVFDNTKFWPEKQFPLKPIGILTYNRMASNHFAEVEQFAVDPANLVPGIRIPPQERILQARTIMYNDAQNYRIGPNHEMLPINMPRGLKDPLRTYLRDGPMDSDTIQGGAPNYYPNTFGGPKLRSNSLCKSVPLSGKVGRYDLAEDNTHYVQVIEYVNETISRAERKRTADNLGDSLAGVEPFIRDDMMKIFREKIDPDFAKLIQNRLNGGRNADEEEDEPVVPDPTLFEFVDRGFEIPDVDNEVLKKM